MWLQRCSRLSWPTSNIRRRKASKALVKLERKRKTRYRHLSISATKIVTINGKPPNCWYNSIIQSLKTVVFQKVKNTNLMLIFPIFLNIHFWLVVSFSHYVNLIFESIPSLNLKLTFHQWIKSNLTGLISTTYQVIFQKKPTKWSYVELWILRREALDIMAPKSNHVRHLDSILTMFYVAYLSWNSSIWNVLFCLFYSTFWVGRFCQ